MIPRIATLFTLLPVLTRAADSPLFAAPATPTVPSAAGGAMRIAVSLVFVVLAVFAAAWLAKRMRRLQAGASGGIELLAQVTLGNRERAVLMKVGEERFLVGVATGGVSLLHRFEQEAKLPGETGKFAPSDELPRPNFAALLRKGLGL